MDGKYSLNYTIVLKNNNFIICLNAFILPLLVTINRPKLSQKGYFEEKKSISATNTQMPAKSWANKKWYLTDKKSFEGSKVPLKPFEGSKVVRNVCEKGVL